MLRGVSSTPTSRTLMITFCTISISGFAWPAAAQFQSLPSFLAHLKILPESLTEFKTHVSQQEDKNKEQQTPRSNRSSMFKGKVLFFSLGELNLSSSFPSFCYGFLFNQLLCRPVFFKFFLLGSIKGAELFRDQIGELPGDGQGNG